MCTYKIFESAQNSKCKIADKIKKWKIAGFFFQIVKKLNI